ncbi:NAD(P)H-dependent oxidoreductase [Microbacterium sp. LRZ72]|uniref:flavodoxin family protein n=1 Tax=Microbacterium sp. LRZ72 TaxID=2942481 RepID=UPI0029ADE155|nr:NAD(P)H-dependent oxidoreductase [Microbacterium sp. LRZ72]MDX2376528.1 NAD(P)H-dependent oxidoreductase [Microbacterium sp. LRZ72]
MLRALALNCTLTPSPGESSTGLLAHQVLEQLAEHGVETEQLRVVDYDIAPGVEKHMGPGDQWPTIRERVLAADILVLATPTWMGQHSSIAQRVLERLDAELAETDDAGRPILSGKVAITAVVGNEDGAHHITAVLYQALADAGFSIPSQGGTYWNGQAMHTTDYKDLDETPSPTASATAGAARNAAHLAAVLQERPYPVG